MDQSRHPRVDIIIAARNEERFLGSCLDALKEQDYPRELLQIYLVDNGSTDRTIQIAKEHGINVLRQSKRGAAAARNAGIAESNGELIGFVDAHCIPGKSWVRLMADQFKLEELGGCQGTIDNRSINVRLQKYLDDSRVLSNEKVIEDTISGKRNVYPWILTGNCMYRRAALLDAGLFNEELQACEDVELAWRVVLLGYQLSYVPQALLTHFNCDSWLGFFRKGFDKGRGAAMLATAYKPHGAREKFKPAQIWSTKPERLLTGLYYWAGYRYQGWRLRLKLDAPKINLRFQALKKFREDFEWTSRIGLQISPEAVFWFRNESQPSSVIVHVPTRLRVVLDKVGDFIWRRIARKTNRDKLVTELSDHYGVATVTAAADLDEFVEELIESRILIKV